MREEKWVVLRDGSAEFEIRIGIPQVIADSIRRIIIDEGRISRSDWEEMFLDYIKSTIVLGFNASLNIVEKKVENFDAYGSEMVYIIKGKVSNFAPEGLFEIPGEKELKKYRYFEYKVSSESWMTIGFRDITIRIELPEGVEIINKDFKTVPETLNFNAEIKNSRELVVKIDKLDPGQYIRMSVTYNPGKGAKLMPPKILFIAPAIVIAAIIGVIVWRRRG